MKEGCKLDTMVYAMIRMDSRCKDGDVCYNCNYDISECPHSSKISVGCSLYRIIEKGERLPKVKAWCRDCHGNSAVPIYKIITNRKEAYVVECTKCKSIYVIYVSDYTRKYTGFRNMKGDFVPPSKDGKLPNYLEKKYKKQSVERRLKFYENQGYSEEEAKERIKSIDKKEVEDYKKFMQEIKKSTECYRKEIQKKQLESKSEERRRLIAEGILVYDKRNKCLVNKNTGERYIY